MKSILSLMLAASAAVGAVTLAIFVHADPPAAAPGPGAGVVDPKTLLGLPAPDFSLPDLVGKNHSLADAKGHVLVLDFWATWCVPCHEELPHLDKLYQEQSPKGLYIWAIDINDDVAKVPQYAKDNHLTLPVLLDKDSALTGPYKVDEQPETLVIGKDGKVKNVFVGYNEAKSPGELTAAVTAAMAE